jgi:hypothetical protein
VALSKGRILYDKYYEAEFARPNLDVYLPGLYRTQSELIVLFLCPEYAAKRWCNLEWRHIRNLLATVDEQRIMFLRHGYEGDFSDLGILPGDGTINFKNRSPEDIADRILDRLRLNRPSVPRPPAPLPPHAAAPLAPPAPPPVDISRIDRYAPAELIGREAETKLVDDFDEVHKLIETCGYGRRREELEDAEAAWRRVYGGGA